MQIFSEDVWERMAEISVILSSNYTKEQLHQFFMLMSRRVFDDRCKNVYFKAVNEYRLIPKTDGPPYEALCEMILSVNSRLNSVITSPVVYTLLGLMAFAGVSDESLRYRTPVDLIVGDVFREIVNSDMIDFMNL